MDDKKVITGMYLEFPDRTQVNVLDWRIEEYENQTITSFKLSGGSEFRIVSDHIGFDYRGWGD